MKISLFNPRGFNSSSELWFAIDGIAGKQSYALLNQKIACNSSGLCSQARETLTEIATKLALGRILLEFDKTTFGQELIF